MREATTAAPGADPAMAPPVVLTGTSAAAARLRAEIASARTAACVLIEAEPGLDVADIARELRRRDGGPFVAVACGVRSPRDLEGEVFGTGIAGGDDLECVTADSAVARANGGTLFLDDVTQLPAPAQSRLARVLRDGQVAMAGHVTPVALTLVAAIEPGQSGAGLRRDLQKHLDRQRIVVPPLRQRASDLPLLVERVLAAAAQRSGLPPLAVTHPAMTVLGALPWNGNLLELRQALARLTVAAAGGVIQLEDVLAHVRFDGSLVPRAPGGTLRDARQQFERDYIALVIAHHRGHIGAAAQALGMQRTNLYRKARQLGLAVRLRAGRPGRERA